MHDLAAMSPQQASETKEDLRKAIDTIHGASPFNPLLDRRDVGIK